MEHGGGIATIRELREVTLVVIIHASEQIALGVVVLRIRRGDAVGVQVTIQLQVAEVIHSARLRRIQRLEIIVVALMADHQIEVMMTKRLGPVQHLLQVQRHGSHMAHVAGTTLLRIIAIEGVRRAARTLLQKRGTHLERELEILQEGDIDKRIRIHGIAL